MGCTYNTKYDFLDFIVPTNLLGMESNILSYEILDNLYTDKDGNLLAYQMIEPVESPLFNTCNKVMNWYTSLNGSPKHNSHYNYLIVKHTIASSTTNLDAEIVAQYGEIISTEEYKMFDKQNKVWK